MRPSSVFRTPRISSPAWRGRIFCWERPTSEKGSWTDALATYRKYLEVYRTAPDREKILKRIEKLESQTARTQAKKSG